MWPLVRQAGPLNVPKPPYAELFESIPLAGAGLLHDEPAVA